MDRDDDIDIPEELREGLDQVDTANALDCEIKRLSDKIVERRAMHVAMRAQLSPEYHSTFDALVYLYDQHVEKPRRLDVKQFKRQADDLRREAAEAGDRAEEH